MNIHFEITRPISALSREVWRFCTLDNALVVESYRVEARASHRHQTFKAEKAYQRLSYNFDNKAQTRLAQDEVPLPDDVVEEARREFVSRVRIGFWQPSR